MVRFLEAGQRLHKLFEIDLVQRVSGAPKKHIPCHVMSCHILPFHAMPCHVMSCQSHNQSTTAPCTVCQTTQITYSTWRQKEKIKKVQCFAGFRMRKRAEFANFYPLTKASLQDLEGQLKALCLYSFLLLVAKTTPKVRLDNLNTNTLLTEDLCHYNALPQPSESWLQIF